MNLRSIVLNMGFNTATTIASVVAGFVTMPFLVRTLGAESYGFWILIASLSGYFGLLDLGVGPAVGRLVAGYRATGDIAETNIIVSTATMLLLGVLAVTGIATIGAIVVFPKMFAVRPEQATDVSVALALVGANLALTFPGSVYSAVLWGYARFDLSGAIETAGIVVRSAATFALVTAHRPLTTLACITLGISVSTILAKAICCHRIEPGLRVSRSLFDRSRLGEIYSFGIWMGLLSLSRTLIPQIPLAVIGSQFSVAAVTSFVVARQLVAYSDNFAVTATQIFAPQAAALHSLSSDSGKRDLFLYGGRFATTLALLFAAGAWCLGRPFLSIWQPLLPAISGTILLILMLGECFPMSQWLSYSVLVGSKRLKGLAVFALAECVLTAGLSLLVLKPFGLIGLSIALAITATLTRGIARWVYCSRTIAFPLMRYLQTVTIRGILSIVVPTVAFHALFSRVTHWTWLSFIWSGLAFAAVFAGCAFVGLVPPEMKKTVLARVQRR